MQTRLRIGPPNDIHEQEADRVADRVMRMPAPPELAPAASLGAGVPEVTEKPLFSADGDGLDSPGRRLDPAARAFVEPRFGCDFGQVRIHTGEPAEHAARAVGARAFTLGRNVVFGANEYAPGKMEGRRLLAHELTHVVQQAGGFGGFAHASPPRLQRQEAETPPTVEEGPESAASVDQEDPEASASELDALAADALAAGRGDAPEVLARVAAFEPLAEAVARLDGEEEALGHLLKVLGPDGWLAENRANLLAILPLRSAERNVETIQDEIDKGLLQLDFGVSADEAHMVYEVFKALSPADRARFLLTPEGQEAFEKMGERASYELRVSREFGFYDADVEALLAELESLETWTEDKRGWLRTVFTMLVQGGHAEDPRVVTFVRHNWELQPEFFAGLGFNQQGLLAPEDLRDTPNPRWIQWFTKVGLTSLFKDFDGTIQLALQFAGGKRSHVEGLPVAKVPLGAVIKGLGGTLAGIDLENIPGLEDSGEATISIDEREGSFILDVTSAAIPTLDLTGKDENGATFTITATNGSFGELHIEARWPGRENPIQLPVLEVRVGWLGLGTTVFSAGSLLAGAERIQLQNLKFEASVSAANENGKFKIKKFVGNLQDQLAGVVTALQQAIFAVITTVFRDARSPDETEVHGAAWFTDALRTTLATQFDGALLGHATIGSLIAENIVFAGGETLDRVATAVDLTIAAGPRALATLEMARMEEAAAGRDLNPAEQARLEELMRVEAADNTEAFERLSSLGMDPEAVELRLKLDSPEGEDALAVDGIDVPGLARSPTLVSPGKATIDLHFPGENIRIPGGVDPDSEGRVLYTITLDAPGQVGAPEELALFGLPTLGPISAEGVTGEAVVREGGVVSLDVVVPKVEFEGVRSPLSIDAKKGVASNTHVVGDLVLDSTDKLRVVRIEHFSIFVELVTAEELIIERHEAWRLQAFNPVLNALRLTVGVVDGKLVAETLHVGPGSISGLEASIGSLLKVSSKEALSFASVEIEEIVPYKMHGFTIADLDTNQVKVETGDQSFNIVRFDGKDVGGILGLDLETGELSGAAFTIEGGTLALGAIDLEFPWGRVAAERASLPTFTATAYATIERGNEGEAAESLDLVVEALDAQVVDVDGLSFELPTVGVRGSLKSQPGALEGIEIRNVELALDATGISAKGGSIAADRTRLTNLETWVRDVAFARSSAQTGKLSFQFFSDKAGGRFRLEDLSVDSEGWVQVMNGKRGAFVLEAFTAEVVEGSITEKGLEIKIPAGNLDLGPVDFTYAGVHLKCRSASATAVSLSLRVEAGKAAAGGAAPLQITLVGAEAPVVHVGGLEFELMNLGVRGSLVDHPGVLEGVELNGVEAVLSSKGFTVESGKIEINRTEAGGAFVEIANLLSGRVSAGAGAVTVEFFSDQEVKFKAEDVTVEANGEVTIAGGNPGKFLLVSGTIKSVEAVLRPESTEGVVRGIELGSGFYDDGNLRIDFKNMTVDAAFSKGALDLGPHHVLSPSLVAEMEANGIGTLLGIDLESAEFKIRDVRSLPGVGTSIGLSQLDLLETVAKSASGTFKARLMVDQGSFLRTVIDATVHEGRAVGSFSENWVGVSPVKVPEVIPFDTEFARLINATKSVDLFVDSLPLSRVDVREIVANAMVNTAVKAEISEIDAQLNVRIDLIPIGNFGYLGAAAQSRPQVMLVATGDTKTGVKIDFSLGALSMDAVVWSEFVVSTQGLTIEEGEIHATFDGVIPKSVRGKIHKGRIDAMKLFGAPEATRGAGP